MVESRKFLDAVQAQVVDGEHPDYTITRATPKFDDFICYIYEIDLDHHTYHYGGFPKFRLDNLPEDEIFEESIGKDGFGHPMPTEALPEEHMYRWHAILPPKPLDIKAYEAYKEPGGKFEALQAMPDAHSTLTNAQESCVRLYKIIAGAFVTNYALHSALSSSELYCDDGEDAASMPPFVEEAALKSVVVALRFRIGWLHPFSLLLGRQLVLLACQCRLNASRSRQHRREAGSTGVAAPGVVRIGRGVAGTTGTAGIATPGVVMTGVATLES
ncbi:polymerase II transcription elongation factor [Salix suchowensis]|nr:polymerase II transcription elongation factor [Salix suchowensis]